MVDTTDDRDGRSDRDQPGRDPGEAQPAGSSAEAPAPGIPLTQKIGRFAVAIIAVLFGVFAVVNAQEVEFDYLFGSAEIPLILVLLGAFVLGGLAAWFATWRSRRQAARRSDRDDPRS